MRKLFFCILTFCFLGFSLSAHTGGDFSVAFSGFGGGLPSSAVPLSAEEDEIIRENSEDAEKSSGRSKGCKIATWVAVGVVGTIAVGGLIFYLTVRASSSCADDCFDSFCSDFFDKCGSDCADSMGESCGDSMSEDCNSSSVINTFQSGIIPVFVP